jgi:hypothetical protein
MSAKVGPSSTICPGATPRTFTTGTTPPITLGNCSSPYRFSSWTESGMSLAPKVTVLDSICLMPPPEPID